MDTPIVMPQLGNEIDEALIVAWLKAPGDKVAAGEAIATIETPKVTLDIEAPASGTLREIVAQVDEIHPVGATLGHITSA